MDRTVTAPFARSLRPGDLLHGLRVAAVWCDWRGMPVVVRYSNGAEWVRPAADAAGVR